MSYLGIRISEGMEKELDKICKLSKRSKSSIVKEALATYIEDQTDYYKALEALEKYKKEGGVSWEQVKKENGLLDNKEN